MQTSMELKSKLFLAIEDVNFFNDFYFKTMCISQDIERLKCFVFVLNNYSITDSRC